MEHVWTAAVPVATTYSELTSEEFLRAFAEEVGVEVRDLTRRDAEDRSVATMDWWFHTERQGIPELAKRFLPPRVHLRWEQSWGPLAAQRATGRLEVRLLGRPSATSTGDCLLTAATPGSTLRTTTATKADLPFPVAGRVESMIDRDLVGWILSVQARVLARRNAG